MIDNEPALAIMAGMGIFENFTKNAFSNALRVLGEPASIGGNQFRAAFDESDMDVTYHSYGEEDEVTTMATCLKSELSNEPRVGETLKRIDQRKSYVITSVMSDVNTYRIGLREKNG